MNRLSARQIERYLQEYSLGIDGWAPGIGDTDQVYGARRLLQDAALTPAQERLLAGIDARAAALWATHRESPDYDALMLRDIVALGDAPVIRKAA